MRVIHWYPNFLGGGGVATAVYALALAQQRAGAEVWIATASANRPALYGGADDTAHLVEQWSPSWTVSAGGLVLRWIDAQDRRRLRSLCPDIVHAHGEFNPDNYWPLRVYRVPLVLSIQGAFNPLVFSKTKAVRKRVYLALAKRLIYRKLASFHALSPDEAEHVRAVWSDAPLYVLPQGGSPTVQSRVRALEPSHQGDGPMRVLFVGRLDVFTKGLDLLLDAVGTVVREDHATSFQLTFVGPDWRGGRERLEDQAKQLKISEFVRFAGEASADQVADYLQAADAFALVSRHEGFSLSATEALLAAKPVIMTTATGHSSYQEIAAFPHVLLVRPGVEEIANALRTVRDRVTELTDSAISARKELESFFSWERIARQHLDRYRELIRGASIP